MVLQEVVAEGAAAMAVAAAAMAEAVAEAAAAMAEAVAAMAEAVAAMAEAVAAVRSHLMTNNAYNGPCLFDSDRLPNLQKSKLLMTIMSATANKLELVHHTLPLSTIAGGAEADSFVDNTKPYFSWSGT